MKHSQWTNVYGPFNEINSESFQNLAICLQLCLEIIHVHYQHTFSSLDVAGELIAKVQEALSPNLFRLVCGICKFLVFDLRVLVVACLTNNSLYYAYSQ